MSIEYRQWASRRDKEIPKADYEKYGIQDPGTLSHDRSPDAIDGAYGIQWYEYFLDRETGQPYKVRCYDGVNRSKGAFDEEAEAEAARVKEAALPTNDRNRSPSNMIASLGSLLVDLNRIAFGFDYEAGEFGLDKRRFHIGVTGMVDLSISLWIEPEDYSDPTDNEPVNIAHIDLDGRLKLLNNFKIGVTDLTGVEVDKEGLIFEDAVKAASVVFAELVEAGYSDPSAP